MSVDSEVRDCVSQPCREFFNLAQLNLAFVRISEIQLFSSISNYEADELKVAY